MTCRVKICGITNLADAMLACDAGADALGFVFYEKSPRYISPERANAIVAELPPFITPVALFVDAPKEQIDTLICDQPRWVIQFHGNETEAECLQYQRSYIKALRVKADEELSQCIEAYPTAQAILLDAYKPGVPGGTGETFNWSLIPEAMPKPLILAGGLTPRNVSQAVQQTQPYAVDVSGGVEQSKGKKNHQKVKEFINGAKSG
ncbi:phosphoribosylanthranilate isomerase [Marinomonas epiphytica]